MLQGSSADVASAGNSLMATTARCRGGPAVTLTLVLRHPQRFSSHSRGPAIAPSHMARHVYLEQ